MQSESGRYINSVSDLYGDDEIEFLLDDIRDLEPRSCNPEDIQVFVCAWDLAVFAAPRRSIAVTFAIPLCFQCTISFCK